MRQWMNRVRFIFCADCAQREQGAYRIAALILWSTMGGFDLKWESPGAHLKKKRRALDINGPKQKNGVRWYIQ